MEPTVALLHRVAAMRKAMAIPDDEDIERAWRRWTGLDLEVGDVREALRGEESDSVVPFRRANLHRASDPSTQGAGHRTGATVHEVGARGPAHGGGRDRGDR